MRVCTTGYAGAEEKGHWEAGFQEDFMGNKAGRVGGKIGWGYLLSFLDPRLWWQLSPGTCKHDSVHTEVGWDGAPED